jgi:hypothetical protein
MEKAAPSIKQRYPKTWTTDKHVARVVRNILLSEELCDEYAEYFRGKSEEELEEIAKSFALGKYWQLLASCTRSNPSFLLQNNANSEPNSTTSCVLTNLYKASTT